MQSAGDLGTIASSRRPEALDLFRTVLLSSSAIPAVFAPSFIKVAAGGDTYDEMHVDGGTTREVFLVPTQFMASRTDARLGINPVRRAYIIRNGHVAPEYRPVKAKTLSIGGRAVSSLIKSQGVCDLYELFVFARKNKSTTSTQSFGGLHDQAVRSRVPHRAGGLSLEDAAAAAGLAMIGSFGAA